MQKRITALLVSVMTILTMLPLGTVFADEGAAVPAKIPQDARRVYLHARGENPTVTENLSHAYRDEVVNVYFAVDNPNKGRYITDDTATDDELEMIANKREDAITKAYVEYEEKAEKYSVKALESALLELEKLNDESLTEEEKGEIKAKYENWLSDAGEFDSAKYKADEKKEYIDTMAEAAADRAEDIIRHAEPQNDMNGFTIKIIYDCTFFDLAAEETSPINFKVPNESGNSEQSQVKPDASNELEVVPDKGAYFYEIEPGFNKIEGTDLAEAYVTVLYTGSYLPMEKEEVDADGNPVEAWYNICALPLIPRKTGSSVVRVDMNSGDKYQLTLFAKDVVEPGYDATFEFDPVNSLYHTINVTNRPEPQAPIPDRPEGTYPGGTEIVLNAEDDCTIWYSKDGGPYIKYWEPDQTEPKEKIIIDQSTVIKTYAERTKGVETADYPTSRVATYTYNIIPNPPTLFYDRDFDESTVDDKVKVDFECYREREFDVYLRDTAEWQEGISDNVEIWYTYSEAAFDSSELSDSTSPEDGWAKLSKLEPKLNVNKPVVLRAVVVSSTGKASEIKEYRLGIKPAPVTITPGTNLDCTEPFEVTLGCDTPDAVIVYTTDSSSPRDGGIIYDSRDGITVDRNMSINAISYILGADGQKHYCDTVTTATYMFVRYTDDHIDAFYPAGTYEESIYVTLTPQHPDYDIVYMREGIETDFVDYDFNEPISVTKNTTIKAKVRFPDGTLSDNVFTFVYRIRPKAPEFSPVSTQFTNTGVVTIASLETNRDNTESYTLYYTIAENGEIPADPRVSGIMGDAETDSAKIEIKGYTTISAVILKDGEEFSDVVTHSYDVVTVKPAQPMTTLTPGYYTQKIDDTEGFFTKFLPVPDGTKIYYTLSYNGRPPEDIVPIPGNSGTYLYDKNADPIPVKGTTVIQAVAVNEFNVRSDIGTFKFIVSPEAPYAPPTADITGDMPIIPIDAVADPEDKTAKLHYDITDEDGHTYSAVVPVPDNGRLYLDTKTGNVYPTEECNPEECLNPTPSDKTFSSPVVINLKGELNETTSGTTTRRYDVKSNPETLASPYADKQTGTYEEIKMDEDNNVLHVRLYSLNPQPNAVIEYKFGNDDLEWKQYNDIADGIVRLKGYTVLQLRARLDDGDGNAANDAVSDMVSYVYDFIPLPPVIEKESGTYVPPLETEIFLDDNAPEGIEYKIMYRKNGDGVNKVYYEGIKLPIPETLSFKAYVINPDTGRSSRSVVNYYIIEDTATSGLVGRTPDPRRISASDIGKGIYTEGIKLYPKKTDEPVEIFYKYAYKTIDMAEDDPEIVTPFYIYSDKMPIQLNTNMDYIKMYAYLAYVDGDGRMVEGSETDFHIIDIVHLDPALTNLEIEKPGVIEWEYNKEWYPVKDAKYDDKVVLYYTIDGSDPSDASNENRIRWESEENDTRKLTKATNVKTVYYSSCNDDCYSCKSGNYDECWYSVYGPVSAFTYTVPTRVVSGGGGGGSTVDKTRKYTVDMFGNEHPTHISYIKGYPDGSVKPEGNITREEVAVILYRIKQKDYDEPFTMTGDVFPDVNKDRWSVYEIEYMTQSDVIYGYPDGTFVPSGNLTRAEFSALIRRFINAGTDESESPFSDLEETHWAYKDIMGLYREEIMIGYEDGTFRPEAQITRAEVMNVINKILGRNPSHTYVKSLDFKPFNDLSIDKWYYVDVMEATITHNYYLDARKPYYEIKWEDCK